MRVSDRGVRPMSVAEAAGPFTFFGFIVVPWQALSIILTSGSWWAQGHMDGTLTGAKPRMRHRPDCRHFKWPGGKVLGTPAPATEGQLCSLRPCKSCCPNCGSVGTLFQPCQ